ncbi:FHA domain-containing protein [Klenkia soli]|uniref:FHA domain-containing protein n=1 Tax=Klenkia soli TaxID=1052260 RepID=A0A1H0KWT0_9ACTN|nr:FHA domain-containing protein [Klenkia soli]SDO60231.1 FHA domain-containing protein [Klenkia soli]
MPSSPLPPIPGRSGPPAPGRAAPALPAPASAGAATVPAFDQVAVSVVPGSDLVVRMPGLLLVVVPESAPPAPRASAGLDGWGRSPGVRQAGHPVALGAPGPDRLAELVGLCRKVSAEGSRAPGRRLQETLGGWLDGQSAMPSLAVAAATEDGLAITLVGSALAQVPELGLRLSADEGDPLPDGTPRLERTVDWPPAALRLSAGTDPGGSPHPLADLESGSVPGGAAVLSPVAAPSSTGAFGPSTTAVRLPPPGAVSGPTDAPTPPVVSSAPPPRPAGPSEPPAPLPAPARSANLLAPAEPLPVAAPLPVVSSAQPVTPLVAEEADDRPRVHGFLCSRGHLNDPRVHFCALCGIRMAERTGVFLEGVRPPLGLLVFDNGATVNLDADYLLGREPDSDERVLAGELRPLLVVDTTGGVSRHHLEVRLHEWDVLVIDAGSANGTLVAAAGAPGWSSLVPGQAVRLTPGTAVRLGGRQFAFQSPHGGF